MSIYFRESQIPCFAGLTSKQRRIVRGGAYKMSHQDHPRARWLVGLPGGLGWGLGWLVGSEMQHMVSINPLLFATLVSMLFGVICSILGTLLIHIPSVVPYYERFIQEHRDEISRAA